jgi:hypothetical protein
MGVREDRVLDATQAAALLGVKRRWLVREDIRKFKVPFIRPPGSNQILFLESDLWRTVETWRANDKVGTPPRDERAKSLDRKSPKKKGRHGQLSGR